jgi:hypothetical protein
VESSRLAIDEAGIEVKRGSAELSTFLILLLTGTERDQNGVASTGALAINPPGSCHRVASDAGSIVLAIWEAPVKAL